MNYSQVNGLFTGEWTIHISCVDASHRSALARNLNAILFTNRVTIYPPHCQIFLRPLIRFFL